MEDYIEFYLIKTIPLSITESKAFLNANPNYYIPKEAFIMISLEGKCLKKDYTELSWYISSYFCDKNGTFLYQQPLYQSSPFSNMEDSIQFYKANFTSNTVQQLYKLIIEKKEMPY